MEQDKDAAASDLGDSIISDSEPGIADKRQLNLNHEYERSERARECARGRKGERKGEGTEGRESENDRHAKRGSPSPDGNLMVAL